MDLTKFIFLFCSLFLGTVQGTSNIPVIFVHGFFGFGPDELFGFGYWPYASEFQDEGFTTYEASVGPVSSNWDRACELYAQIKGGTVDYGSAHSSREGHNRFGKTYAGFYPSWSESNPVHLVGHSMGGQTIRMLETLLREGDPDEISAGASSNLFTGGNNWIKTITTLSTPHDGTTLVDILGDGFVDLIRDILVFFAGFFDSTGLDGLYDFDLEHWGLERGNSESANDYWDRLSDTIFDDDITDIAPFDLSPVGARIQNERSEQVYSDTYYFAFASEDTFKIYQCFWFLRCGNVEKGELTMNILLQPFASQMGNLDRPELLRKNDGVVPWASQKCPTLGYSNPNANCQEFNGNWPQGKWIWMDVPYLDHLQTSAEDWFRDTFSYGTSAKKLYRDHAQRIRELDVPSYTASGFTSDVEVGNAAAQLDPEIEPSSAGAILLVVSGCVLGLFAIGVAVKLRNARNSNNVSTFKGTMPSFSGSMPSFSGSRKGTHKGSVTKMPSHKISNLSFEGGRQYSSPPPSLASLTPKSVHYSVDLEASPKTSEHFQL